MLPTQRGRLATDTDGRRTHAFCTRARSGPHRWRASSGLPSKALDTMSASKLLPQPPEMSVISTMSAGSSWARVGVRRGHAPRGRTGRPLSSLRPHRL